MRTERSSGAAYPSYGSDASGQDGPRRRAGRTSDLSRSHPDGGQSTALGSLQNLRPPCVKITDNLAQQAKEAVDSGRSPEVVRKSLQAKQRADEYTKMAVFEGTMGAATAAVQVAANWSPGTKAALTTATLATQAWPAAHVAVATRAGNVHRMTKKNISDNFGEDVATEISKLPYNATGLSNARQILNRTDARFSMTSTDPRFNTAGLVKNEVRKGGSIEKILKEEMARSVETSAQTGAPSSSFFPSDEIRKRR